MPGLTKRIIERFALARGHGEFADCLLLDFLNTARTGAEIAIVNNEVFPPQVPSLDGKESLIKSFEIPIASGEEILAKRASLGGSFSKLSQLSSIETLGNAELGILLKAFSISNVVLRGVMFDHDANGFSNDALPMRRNSGGSIAVPEWEDFAGYKKGEDSPACYSIADTAGNTISIKAKFSGPANQVIHIKAKNVGDSQFGTPKARAVAFDANGESDWVEFELEGVKFQSKGVKAYDVSWRWHFAMREQGSFCPFGRPSNHRIYAVLEAPKAPWVLLRGSSQAPWQSALELVCEWAQGAKDVDEAAAQIAIAHFNSGLTYVGVANYSTPFDFFLSDYLEKVNNIHSSPLPSNVNCSDCAAAISTLSNLAGHDLWQSKMGLENRPFQFENIVPIGERLPISGTFVFHEVAWKGNCDFSENLFDACLKLDDPLQAQLPIDLPFGTCNSGGYRELITTASFQGCLLCPEKPATRIRRFLI